MGRPRTAVSQWHALKAWGTQWPPCLQCSYPQNSTTCGLVLQIMCVISLFSGLFDILCPQSFSDTIFKFHPCQVLIPTLPPLIPLSELKNVFDVFTHFLLVPLWELVVFFSGYPSVFPPHMQCLTSGKVPLATHNRDYQPKMDETDIPTILFGDKMGYVPTCFGVWMALGCAPHSPPHIWCCSEKSFTLRSSPICSSPLPLPSLFFHYIKTPEKSAEPWVVFMLELDRNCHSTHVWSFLLFTLFLAPL